MLIYAFWIFIAIMLIWQVYSYDQGAKQAALDHPQQTKFLFLPPTTTPTPAGPVKKSGPDVQQTAFRVQNGVPNAASFTCYVTLKNMGSTKAVGVQIMVRPYRGASSFDEDVGHSQNNVLSEDDPLSQYGAWLSFPDLAPDESATRSIDFIIRNGPRPGSNPDPAISFEPDKAAPPATKSP
jgi:hypothetical protein